MTRTLLTMAGAAALLISFGAAPARAAGPYPAMAPMEQYRSASVEAEIALARSAAPPEISNDAEILVLGEHGYETAVKGKNGFVCDVERSWANKFDEPEFWNPKMRAPTCYNAAAARSVLPEYLKRTEWLLAGASREEMARRTQASIAARVIGAPETGSMAYMMSRDQYLGDAGGGHWHPHLMFFLPPMPLSTWGAGIKGGAVFGDAESPEPITVFFVPVPKWSDGTSAMTM